MDHVGIDPACPKPTGEPKTIPPGLIRDRNPGDLLPGLGGFVFPAVQKLQQHLWIGINFLPGFALDTRDHAGDQPAGQTHFYNHGQCAILNEGGEACFAIVVGLLHNGSSVNDVDRSDDLTALSRRLPHSIFWQNYLPYLLPSAIASKLCPTCRNFRLRPSAPGSTSPSWSNSSATMRHH